MSENSSPSWFDVARGLADAANDLATSAQLAGSPLLGQLRSEVIRQISEPRHQAEQMTTALDWFQHAADHGDDAAMYALGNVAYSKGELAAASTWFRRAADLGNAAAMNGLGWLADEDGDRTTALTS